jgi:tetratricopeptide (TPR) repeat protein
MIGDVVGATRAAHRLQMDAGAAYLRPYRRLAEATTLLVSGSYNLAQVSAFLEREVSIRDPRGFIGWAMTHSGIVRGLLAQGQAERAESWCLSALEHIKDEDREYVTLFLDLDLQLANAQAALGKFDAALTRLELLIARHATSEHPLALGLLHEARARIAHAAGRRDVYEQSTREAERWFRPTNTPQLIAKCERLWELARQSTGTSMRPSPDPSDPASLELTSGHGFRPVSSARAEKQTSSSVEARSAAALRTETSVATLLDGLDPRADEPSSGG